MPAPFAYVCPWCMRRKGWIGTKAEVLKHMDGHMHDKDPADAPIPIRSDPFDVDNLRKLERVDHSNDISCIGPYTDCSAFILTDGTAVISGFGRHHGMAWEAMEMSGLEIMLREPDIDDYVRKTGIVSVHKFGQKITVSGHGATAGQIRTLKDIMLYAKISDPGKVECTIPAVRAATLCRGVAA